MVPPLTKLEDILRRGEEGDLASLALLVHELSGNGAASEAVSTATKHLTNRAEGSRFLAALTLGYLGPAALGALGALQAAAADKAASVRAGVYTALGMIGPEAASAAATLLAGLTDRDEECRRQAALSCGEVRITAALPALCKRYRSEKQWMVRWNIVTAIVALGGDGPTLSLALNDEADEIRAEAARGLRKRPQRIARPALEARIRANEKEIARIVAAFGGENRLDQFGAELVTELRQQVRAAKTSLKKLGAESGGTKSKPQSTKASRSGSSATRCAHIPNPQLWG